MKSFFEFFFPKRLARLSYAVRAILVQTFMLTWEAGIDEPLSPANWVLVGVAVYFLAFVMWPRLRDTAMPRYWIFFALVPLLSAVLGCALLFRRSHPRQNPLFLAVEIPEVPTGDPAPVQG